MSDNIAEELQKALGGFQKSMSTLQGQMLVISNKAKKDLNPEEKEIIAKFEKDAANLDINGLEKLRDKYTQKIKDAKK